MKVRFIQKISRFTTMQVCCTWKNCTKLFIYAVLFSIYAKEHFVATHITHVPASFVRTVLSLLRNLLEMTRYLQCHLKNLATHMESAAHSIWKCIHVQIASNYCWPRFVGWFRLPNIMIHNFCSVRHMSRARQKSTTFIAILMRKF